VVDRFAAGTVSVDSRDNSRDGGKLFGEIRAIGGENSQLGGVRKSEHLQQGFRRAAGGVRQFGDPHVDVRRETGVQVVFAFERAPSRFHRSKVEKIGLDRFLHFVGDRLE
jgi:hypothetical protein